MVKNCSECGEYSFATRYKDSYLSFCRNCGYYEEPRYNDDDKLVTVSGYLDEEEFEELKERFPIRGTSD